MLSLWGGVGRMTSHLSPLFRGFAARRRPSGAGCFANPGLAANLQQTTGIPLCIHRVYDSTWRSYTGGYGKMENGHGDQRLTWAKMRQASSASLMKSSATAASRSQRSHQRGAQITKCTISEQIPLLVILHYLLKSNKERSKWS